MICGGEISELEFEVSRQVANVHGGVHIVLTNICKNITHQEILEAVTKYEHKRKNLVNKSKRKGATEINRESF